MMKFNRLIAAVACAFAVIACESPTTPVARVAAPEFNVQSDIDMVDLGTLGGSASIARAINNAGAIAGYSRDNSNAWKPFIWQNGKMRALGTLGGPCATTSFQCIALGINDRGDVVGATTMPDGSLHATLWPRGGLAEDLGILGGCCSRASDINDQGQVVGYIATATGQQHAALFSHGQIEDLGTLGGTTANAVQINDRGEVAGISSVPSSPELHGFYWSRATGMIDLGSLGPAAGGCSVRGINNEGQIEGCRFAPSLRGIVWTVVGGVVSARELATYATPGTSNAWQANEPGEVVGATFVPHVGNRAALWDQAGNVSLLGSLGGQSLAFGINNNGDAIGESFYSGSSTTDRATLWKRRSR